MAENKYLSFAGLSKYDELIKALMTSKDAETLQAAKDYCDSLADNYEASGTVATAKAELQALIDAVEADIAKLNGDATVEGSVDKKIADAKSELNGTISGVDKKVDDLEERVKANEDAIGDTDTLPTTAKNLTGAIIEVRNAVSAGGTAAAITLDTTTTTEGMAKSYTIKQGDNVVGTIDIPKDMVVQSGEVVNLADGDVEGYAAGTYIKLTLANATNDVIYVNVGTLVDIYKAQANATQIQLTIDSSTREISAVVVAESITATELAADAVTTVKIADGNVTKAKLSATVQASLDKADVAEQNAKDYADGLNTDMDTRVKATEAALADGGSVDVKIAEALQEAKNDSSNKDIVVLAEAQKSINEVKDFLNEHANDESVHITEAERERLNSALQPSDIVGGTENGTIAVSGVDIAVKGLGSAAYAGIDAFDSAGSAAQALTDANAYTDTAISNFAEISEEEINALFK